MKIVYVCYLGNLNSFGITKKVVHKVQTLNRIGCTTKGLFFYDSDDINVPNESNVDFIKVKGLNTLFQSKPDKGYLELYQSINAHVASSDFDFILFRYPLSNRHLSQFLTIYGSKTVLEHNSKEEEELEMYIRNFTWRDKFYLLRKGLIKSLRKARYDLRNEYNFKQQVLKKALAGIVVTDEIGQYETHLSGNSYKTITISNGTDVDKLPLKTQAKFDGSILKLIMVNSSPTQWHGVDKVFAGFKKNKNKLPIHLNIVGQIMPAMQQEIKAAGITDYITLHGYKNGDELDQLFNEAHIGIGTLALHRLNLAQGCVLKVREYMSRGIPFVIGYDDVDIKKDHPINNYCLRIPANESALNLDDLWSFGKRVLNDTDGSKKIKQIAQTTIDTTVKMKQLKYFFESQQ